MPNRRSFLAAAGTLAGAAAAHVPCAASAASPAAPSLDLLPFPPSAAPFDAAGRAELAKDLLTYFVRQKGLFPGRGVFLLPAAPWIGGWEPLSPLMAWDFTVPAGHPLYLLAAAETDGALDPTGLTVWVNGTSLPDLDDYVHGGIAALHAGETKQHSVLDLVFAPPAPGRYKLEVKSDETTLLYDVTVQPQDALGPILLRDPGGRVFATHARERRHVPNPETFHALGYPGHAIVNASDALLDSLPEGAPLPPLRDGMLVRADDHHAVFRLEGGRRVWLRDFTLPVSADPDENAALVTTIEAAVLAAIPPVLQNDMLIKSGGPDAYHVDRGTLRKIPDWKWVTERRLSPADAFFVPDRIIAGLPQNSPHWVMPGGAFEDHTFDSDALDRQMPYRVFLPPDYYARERANERYPVLYLLHGMGGRYDEWSGYGVEEVANLLMNEGRFPHTIIVAPQGGLGYWMNQDGGTPWADYVAKDLVKHVDATYRTIARREARAIGGLSMGAHGALQLSLNYPETFGIAGAHSPSLRWEEVAPRYFGRGSGFARRDPITLARDAQLSVPPRIWIDAGDEDHWLLSAETLHKVLKEKGWEHEWHAYEGGHDGWYWGDHIWDYLPFYAKSFAQNGVPLVR